MADESRATNASTGAQDARALSSAAAPGPTRIRSLDVLRGVGVLGMLAIHIQLFAYPSLTRWNPTAYGDLQGVNWWVWLATSVLADGKFISIFAMLLGVSIVMQAPRVGARAIPAWRVHMRRMAALLVLGLLHAYLLWYGDMLVPLALCGTVVFVARRLSPRWLLVLGGLVFATGSALSFALTWSTAQSDPVALAAWRAQWTPRPAIIDLEIAQYRGGWAEQMAHRVPAALETQTVSFVTQPPLADDGPHADRHGAVQAGRPQRGPLPDLLSAYGEPSGSVPASLLIALGLWRSFATKWDLLDFALVSQQLQLLGQSLRGSGLDCPRDAALPARLAASLRWRPWDAWPSPTTCCRR